MKDTKRVLNRFAFFDSEEIERHLEKMALDGWILTDAGTNLWKYKRIEPQKLIFSVTYFPKASPLDPEPSEEQRTLWEFCEKAGWKLIAQSAQLQIFCNEDENATPIETDPVVQLENMMRSAKRSFLTNYGIMTLLGLMNLVLFVYRFVSDPVDILTSYSQLTVGLIWVLYLFVCTIEPIIFFSWYKKAKKAANEGYHLPLKANRKLQIAVIYAASILLILLGLWLIADSGLKFVAFAVIYIAAIYAVVRLLSQYLKRRKVKASVNMTVSMIVGMAVAFVTVFGGTLAIIKGGEIGIFVEEGAAGTYEHDGIVWEYYEDTLPLTIEDLTGESYDGYSYRLQHEKTFLAESIEGSQRARFDAENYKQLDDLSYSIVKPRVLYNFCKDSMYYKWDDSRNDNIPDEHKDLFHSVDAALWCANEAYRLGEGNRYLICYDDSIVMIVFYGGEPTDEQKIIAGQKLSAI